MKKYMGLYKVLLNWLLLNSSRNFSLLYRLYPFILHDYLQIAKIATFNEETEQSPTIFYKCFSKTKERREDILPIDSSSGMWQKLSHFCHRIIFSIFKIYNGRKQAVMLLKIIVFSHAIWTREFDFVIRLKIHYF